MIMACPVCEGQKNIYQAKALCHESSKNKPCAFYKPGFILYNFNLTKNLLTIVVFMHLMH